jgi:hypothetical protein
MLFLTRSRRQRLWSSALWVSSSNMILSWLIRLNVMVSSVRRSWFSVLKSSAIRFFSRRQRFWADLRFGSCRASFWACSIISFLSCADGTLKIWSSSFCSWKSCDWRCNDVWGDGGTCVSVHAHSVLHYSFQIPRFLLVAFCFNKMIVKLFYNESVMRNPLFLEKKG